MCFPTLNGRKGVCVGQRLMTVIVDNFSIENFSHVHFNRSILRYVFLKFDFERLL